MSQDQLVREIVITAQICGRQLGDLAILAIAEDLAPYPIEKVVLGLREARKTGRFPSVNDLLEMIDPNLDSKDEARMAVGRIMEAISNFGWSQPSQALHHVGPLAWEAVEKFGGWDTLCSTVNANNKGMITAQLRDLLESLHRAHKAGLADHVPQLPEADTKLALTAEEKENTKKLQDIAATAVKRIE